jgi:hypothetical protein
VMTMSSVLPVSEVSSWSVATTFPFEALTMFWLSSRFQVHCSRIGAVPTESLR